MCGRHTIPLESLEAFYFVNSSIFKRSVDTPDNYQHFMTLYIQLRAWRDLREDFDGDKWNDIAIRHALYANSTRECSDPRDRVFAILSLPIVLAQNMPYPIRPDYSMAVEEVAAMTMACLDRIDSESGIKRNPQSSVRSNVEGVVHHRPAQFRVWLRKRAYWNNRQRNWLIPVASGMEIPCSGTCLHHILHHTAEFFRCEDVHTDCSTLTCVHC